MRQAALAITGIAIVGAGCLIAFTPVAPPLPNVHVPALQLTGDTGLDGDLSSLFGDMTTVDTSLDGDLSGLFGDLTGAAGSSDTGAGSLGRLDLGNPLGGLEFNNVLGDPGSGELSALLTEAR